MQTLNVGAGQSDSDYKEAAEKHRADLREESRSDANYFFIAAGCAALGSGLLPLRINVLISVGTVDLLTLYGRSLGALYPIAVLGTAALWVLVVIGLGFAARSGYRWAFLAGIALYAADMLALIALFSIWAFGVHAFFLFKWFQGQKALKDIQEEAFAT